MNLLAWVGIVLGVVYLTFGGGGSFGASYLEWRVASLATIAIAMVAWFVAALRDPGWRPRSVLWPAFLASLAAFAICTVTSWSPRLSLEYVAYAVMCTALYLLLVRLIAHPAFRDRIGALAVLLCLSIGVEFVVLTIVHWVAWWSVLGHVAVPPLRAGNEGLVFGNPSAVATMMLLLFPASVAHLGFGSTARRALGEFLALLTAAVVVLTESRGAWLGLGVGAVGTIAALLLVPSSRDVLRRTARTWTGRLLLTVGGLVGLGAAATLGPAVLARALNSSGDRLTFFLAAIRMFESSPIVGSGPGTWVARRIAFTNGTTGLDGYIPHAHDIYLQTAAEFGVVGLLAGAVVVVSLGWLVYRGMTDADPVRRRYGWAALFAILNLAGHQLVDFYANFPVAMFALALTVGFLDATSGSSPVDRWMADADDARWSRWRPASRTLARLGPAALALVVVASLAFSSWSESVAATQLQAVNDANAGRWAAALPLARQAAAADPDMTPYQFTLGLAAAANGNLGLAREALDRAATASDFPEAWLDLSAVQLQLGDRAGARASLQQAMRLGWQQAQATVPGAALYARLGDVQDAAAVLVYAFVLIPELPADPYWSSTPQLHTAADLAVDKVVATWDPGIAYRVALAAGRTSEALQLAATLGPAAGSATLYVRAWNGDLSARRELEAEALAAPSSPAAPLAELAAARAGEQAMTDRLVALAGQTGLPSTHAQLLIHVAQTCGDCPQMPGANATSWSYFTYRRPVPADLLVLDLPRLAYK